METRTVSLQSLNPLGGAIIKFMLCLKFKQYVYKTCTFSCVFLGLYVDTKTNYSLHNVGNLLILMH